MTQDLRPLQALRSDRRLSFEFPMTRVRTWDVGRIGLSKRSHHLFEGFHSGTVHARGTHFETFQPWALGIIPLGKTYL